VSFCVDFSPFFLHFELHGTQNEFKDERKTRRRTTTTNALKRERFQEEEKLSSSSIFRQRIKSVLRFNSNDNFARKNNDNIKKRRRDEEKGDER